MTYTPHNLSKMVDSLKQYNDKDNQYWVTAAALVVITYNNSLVKEADAPKNWPDLLNPKWKDKVSIGHPAFSGYVGTWTVLMTKLYGWDYFVKLEKNSPQIGRSINDTVTMLNAKERWVAAGPEATTLLSKDKGNPLAVIYPTDGSLLDGLAHRHPEERALAERGQAVRRVPARPGSRRSRRSRTIRCR